jgi:hypothetical protein
MSKSDEVTLIISLIIFVGLLVAAYLAGRVFRKTFFSKGDNSISSSSSSSRSRSRSNS